MGKRIVVVGTGAVGGYTGAHMVRAGEDVTFIDMWPAHVDIVKRVERGELKQDPRHITELRLN
jgi:ketopantoate reductase